MGDGEEFQADVCVVGSGAAGTTVALDLRARGRSVLLLESGGGVRDRETDDLLDLETEALPVGRESRQRLLGGTTNVWWGASATLDDVEFGPRLWLGVPSWPIDRSHLLPYYERSCRLIGVPDLTTTGPERLRKGNGFLVCTDDLDTVTIYWPKRPLRFRTLLEADVGTREIDAYLFANVTGLVMGDGGTRVDRLEVRTITGRRFWVRAKTVVLACGGIENPRLLLASSGGRGLGDGRAATGRYYMDHPKGVVGRVRVDPRARRLPHPAYWDSRPGSFRFGIRLSPARQERDQVLDAYVRLHPILASRGPGTAAMQDVYRRGVSALREPRMIAAVARGIPELLALARFRALNRGTVEFAEIHNFLEQAPHPENRVTLSDRLDRFGNPIARLHWSVGDLDRRTMRVLHGALDDELRERGFGRVESPILDREDREPDLGHWPISRDASHHMGTTRMGDDPSTSVVDRDCRVHGIENLYVAGSSVFPTCGFANPTLTIVALAMRLADHLAAR